MECSYPGHPAVHWGCMPCHPGSVMVNALWNNSVKRSGHFLLPGSDRRPANVLIPHWAGGGMHYLMWLSSIPCRRPQLQGPQPPPTVHSWMPSTVKCQGCAAVQEAGPSLHSTGCRVPARLARGDSGWSEKAGSALGRHTGQEEKETTCQLFQRLSFLLIKRNATWFFNRVR